MMEEDETFQMTFQVTTLESDIRRLSSYLSTAKQIERPYGGPEDRTRLIELRKRCLTLMKEARPREKIVWTSYKSGVWTESHFHAILVERLIDAIQELDTIDERFFLLTQEKFTQ